MKNVEAIWFTEMGSTLPIGIVIGVDEVTGEPKAYIGTAYGNDGGEDIKRITAGGAKLSLAIVKDIVRRLNEKAT